MRVPSFVNERNDTGNRVSAKQFHKRMIENQTLKVESTTFSRLFIIMLLLEEVVLTTILASKFIYWTIKNYPASEIDPV